MSHPDLMFPPYGEGLNITGETAVVDPVFPPYGEGLNYVGVIAAQIICSLLTGRD